MVRPGCSARPRVWAVAILAVAGATIAAALISQHVFGLVPCKLCLLERWPYYAALPVAILTVAILTVAAGRRRWPALAGFVLLAAIFAASATLGAYHAGAEWGFWPGPADCGGGMASPAAMTDFLRSLDEVRIVSCTEAAWRFLGLSLAGWNALVSATLAAVALVAARGLARAQGSSSVSQYR